MKLLELTLISTPILVSAVRRREITAKNFLNECC